MIEANTADCTCSPPLASSTALLKNNIYLFTFGCVGFSLPAAGGARSLVWHMGFSRGGCSGCRARALGLQQVQLVGSVVVAPGLSSSMACGIFLDQGSNPCLLHWQVYSLPLSHQGSPHCRYNLHLEAYPPNPTPVLCPLH